MPLGYGSRDTFPLAIKLGLLPTMENLFWFQLLLLSLNVVKVPFNKRVHHMIYLNIKVNVSQPLGIFIEANSLLLSLLKTIF